MALDHQKESFFISPKPGGEWSRMDQMSEALNPESAAAVGVEMKRLLRVRLRNASRKPGARAPAARLCTS